MFTITPAEQTALRKLLSTLNLEPSTTTRELDLKDLRALARLKKVLIAKFSEKGGGN